MTGYSLIKFLLVMVVMFFISPVGVLADVAPSYSATPSARTTIVRQPDTGISSTYWLVLGGLFLFWIGIQLWQRYQYLRSR